MRKEKKLRVLFLCTGNSCRSQMAEAWARHIKGDIIEAYSAGLSPKGLDQRAVKVMAEAGVDISRQRSKHMDQFKGQVFDYVITVCDQAREACPVFAGAKRTLHVGFDDPPALARGARTEQEALSCYRRVRDQIKAFVEGFPDNLDDLMGRDDGTDPRDVVRKEYGRIAQQGGPCCGPSCCGTSGLSAQALGYEQADLDGIPEGADMGLGCGNPVALAELRPGQVVLDLGAGGGIDVLVAARRVGQSGKAIGVDMTPEMVSKARAAARSFKHKTGLENVEFRLGQIEHLPVADSSVDVVISNCVINLSPDKPQVWREIARVLRPGGRVAISDLALLQPLPGPIRQSVEALVGCVAGAVLVDQTKSMVQDAGLVDAVFQTHPEYVDKMVDWADPLYRKIVGHLPEGTRPSDYITSLYVTACKPVPPVSDQVKELIAVGASVCANCHPCVRYHLKKARDMGISDDQIRQAVEVGRMVRKGAAGQMDELIGQLLG